MAVLIYEKIFRLKVSVDDILVMQLGKGAENFGEVKLDFWSVAFKAILADKLLEVATRQILHIYVEIGVVLESFAQAHAVLRIPDALQNVFLV